MAVSNSITSVLNFTAMLCSIPIILSGIWVALKPDNDCIHWLRWPVLVFGVAILLVSLVGFIGARKNKQGLIAIYVFFMALLISALLLLLVVASIAARPSGAYAVPGRGYLEYRLDGYSSWMRKLITNFDNWSKIRACLGDSELCPELNQKYIGADQLFVAPLSPLQDNQNHLYGNR